MDDPHPLVYIFLAAFSGIFMGIFWGEYRGYRAAQKDFQRLADLVAGRLEVGDQVLTALDKGEKVTVITGEGKNITNLWIKDPKKLKAEDWEAIEETTSQLRARAETRGNKRST